MSVTCARSVVLSGYSGFLHQKNWLPRHSWNIVESDVKHHNPPPPKKNQTLGVISCYFQENVLFFRFIHRKDKDKHIIDNWWTQLSHIMWFVRLGNENNIIIFVPHHTLQPLDVSCFCAHNISIVSDIRVHNFTCNYKIWRWFARWGKRKQHYSICPPP